MNSHLSAPFHVRLKENMFLAIFVAPLGIVADVFTLAFSGRPYMLSWFLEFVFGNAYWVIPLAIVGVTLSITLYEEMYMRTDWNN